MLMRKTKNHMPASGPGCAGHYECILYYFSLFCDFNSSGRSMEMTGGSNDPRLGFGRKMQRNSIGLGN